MALFEKYITYVKLKLVYQPSTNPKHTWACWKR